MNPYSSDPNQSYSPPPNETVSLDTEVQLNPEGNQVDAGRATDWIGQGFTMFKASPGPWIGMIIVLFLILVALSRLRALGSMGSNLLMPVFFGGLMLACQAHAQGKSVSFDYLFAGFKEKFGPLVLLGLFWMIGTVLVGIAAGIVAAIFVGGAMVSGAVWNGGAGLLGMGFGAILVFVLVAMLISIPLAMAIWFAPALVALHNVAPFDALKMSLKASLKNWAAFLLFFIVYIVLAILASIPIGLGWLVLGPTMIGAMYYAYRDIYLVKAA